MKGRQGPQSWEDLGFGFVVLASPTPTSALKVRCWAGRFYLQIIELYLNTVAKTDRIYVKALGTCRIQTSHMGCSRFDRGEAAG